MIITWCLVAVAVLLLWFKISSVRERKGKGRYAEESAEDRRERMNSDAAFEQNDLERRNALERGEESTSMRF